MSVPQWVRQYGGPNLRQDLIATAVVVVMLIPQSLGYAMVAGLPPQVGLYASILPAIVYAFLGTSMTISIGPAAVPALMTLAALSAVATVGTTAYLTAAVILTCLCGVILLVMAAMRFGFLTQFISHTVISGFTTASALIIAASQIRHLLGIEGTGLTLPEIALSLWEHAAHINPPTLILAAVTIGFLVAMRRWLATGLTAVGVPAPLAGLAQRASPLLVVVGSTLLTALLNLGAHGIKVVGDIPAGLPRLALPAMDAGLWSALTGSAALIALLIYVESISIAQTFAAKRRQRVDPDRELWALGAANLASGFSGGCPVAGSFSRSAVNFQAGAQTPAAGVFTAIGISIMALYFTQALAYLPIATLAATIIVAVLPIADFAVVRHTWRYSRGDAIAMFATLLVCLVFGVEAGLATGVVLSVAFFLQRTSRPNLVVLGRLGDTTLFRDATGEGVVLDPRILMIRVDMSLYFANAGYVEELILFHVSKTHKIEHVVLVGSGINMIDANALAMLEELIDKLNDAGITLHLAAFKRSVLARLRRVGFLDRSGGTLFLAAYDAANALGHCGFQLGEAVPQPNK